MLPRYETGKRRFEEAFDVKVIETPNALAGSGTCFDNFIMGS